MSDTLGQLLRETREARGETLDDIERVTHIRVRQLAAIEADDLAALPSPAQARGYIKNYAQHLGLDLQEVLARYEAGQKRRPAAAASPRRDPAPVARGDATRPPRSPAVTRVPPGGGVAAPAPPEPVPVPARTPQIKVRRPRLFSADVLVATVITLLLVALLVWGGSRLAGSVFAVTLTPTASLAAGLTTALPTPSPTPAQEATATLDLPSPAASYSGVNITVRAELRSWVQVKVDGAEKFAGLMPAGEAREFVGKGVVEIVTGNGKGTRIVYNGVDQGVMGELGQVVDRLWTLQGMVIPSPTITPTPSETPTPSKTSPVTSTAAVTKTPPAKATQ
jgi:cytoskeleton protein RodZ